MPKSKLEKDLEEGKQWFKDKIEDVKEKRIIMDVKREELSERVLTKARWSAVFATDVYSHLTDIYELLDLVVAELLKREKEASKFSKELKTLRGKIKSHEPTISKIREAIEQTEEWLEEGR